MRTTTLPLTLAFCLAGCAGQRPTPGSPTSPRKALPFPEPAAVTSSLSLEEIAQQVTSMETKVFRYPTRLRDEDDRLATYQRWSMVVLAGEELDRSGGRSPPTMAILAALYRQGHNLGVTGCAAKADATIAEGLRRYPESAALNWQAAFFYVQVHPRFAVEAEKALLRLRELLGPGENPDVERLMVEAYLHQGKVAEARKQIDHCLAVTPDDTDLLAMRRAINEGRYRLHGTNDP